jgi:uncharacterized lipoprotein YmbA
MSRSVLAIPFAFAIAAATLLSGCASGPGIPETTYYRLPPRADAAPLPAPLFDTPVVVETFLADGLHSDQALLYALDPEGGQLRAYHYQLWVDPPVRMLQRRLMGTLRQAQVAPLVVDRLPAQSAAVRVTGRIERFERIPAGDGWRVSVALGLRADRPGREGPLMVRRYREDVAVSGNTVADSVQSIGAALDRIFAAFVADLANAAA